jgi:hypothetical protein
MCFHKSLLIGAHGAPPALVAAPPRCVPCDLLNRILVFLQVLQIDRQLRLNRSVRSPWDDLFILSSPSNAKHRTLKRYRTPWTLSAHGVRGGPLWIRARRGNCMCDQPTRSASKVASSIRPVTGSLSTDWNQRIAFTVSGPSEPSTLP